MMNLHLLNAYSQLSDAIYTPGQIAYTVHTILLLISQTTVEASNKPEFASLQYENIWNFKINEVV